MTKRWIDNVKQKQTEQRQCVIWRMGQAGFLVYGAGKWLCLDPYLSDTPGRLKRSIAEPEELDFVDILFGSHDHPDHIDREAWPRLFAVNPKVKAIVPEALKESVGREPGIEPGRLLGLKDGETIQFQGIRFTGIASAHEFLEREEGTGNPLYMGVLIDMDGLRIYHPGDTCMYEGLTDRLRSLGPIDAMILPINGRDAKRFERGIAGNMTWQEAADLAGSLRPKVAIPCHYDMFQGNTEDPDKFTGYLKVKYPEQDFWTGEIGACTILNGGR